MHVIILAGGKGMRLWPASTEEKPKFFIKLNSQKSLLQNTFERVTKIGLVTNIITVTNKNYLHQIKSQYSEIKTNIDLSYIIEPSGKDTTAVILSSVLYIHKHYGPNQMVLIVPTDHIIENPNIFQNALKKAKILAESEKIVTFGITPTHAEENYGYIEYSKNKVINFKEKPTREIAKKYLELGNFLWNSGILCSLADTLIEEMKINCPEIFNIIEKTLHLSKYIDHKNIQEVYLDKNIWHDVPSISIDYALLEKTKKIAVVPCEINWRDIGNWNSISKLTSTDINGNNIQGNAMAFKASDCYIQSNGRMIAVIGVKNLAIIETENGLLIVNKKNVADVREVFSMMKEKETLAKIS